MSVAKLAAAPVRESVLVVDPADTGGRSARSMLLSEGRSVHHCATAREALSVLPEVRPDVVVAALDTADLPGLRFLEVLRERTRDVPVIVVTGHPTVEGAVQALKAGAADYLGRPLSPGLLTEKVARALQGVSTARRLAQA